MLRLLIIQLAIFFFGYEGRAQGTAFMLPLHGVPGTDFWIDYYMDHDSSSGIKDGYCGTKTYDSHQGTDFLLRSFKTMDSGVYVYAIADGEVMKAVDGYYYRSKRWQRGGFGNYLLITHSGGYLTHYGHLMKNSLLVKMGDSVKAGQPIAKVGSSGYSTQPHLHLEVHDLNRNLLDPFKGECNGPNSIQWTPDPGYDSAVYPVDYGFVPYIPRLDSLKERYLVRDTFYTNTDTTVCLWVLMHGLKAGDVIFVDWLDPRRNRRAQVEYIWEQNWWFDYTWPYIKMPTKKGKWTVRFFLNGKLVLLKNFCVMERGPHAPVAN